MSATFLLPTILVSAGAAGALSSAVVAWLRARKSSTDVRITLRSGDKLIEIHSDNFDPENFEKLLNALFTEKPESSSDVSQPSIENGENLDTPDPAASPKEGE